MCGAVLPTRALKHCCTVELRSQLKMICPPHTAVPDINFEQISSDFEQISAAPDINLEQISGDFEQISAAPDINFEEISGFLWLGKMQLEL